MQKTASQGGHAKSAPTASRELPWRIEFVWRPRFLRFEFLSLVAVAAAFRMHKRVCLFGVEALSGLGSRFRDAETTRQAFPSNASSGRDVQILSTSQKDPKAPPFVRSSRRRGEGELFPRNWRRRFNNGPSSCLGAKLVSGSRFGAVCSAPRRRRQRVINRVPVTGPYWGSVGARARPFAWTWVDCHGAGNGNGLIKPVGRRQK